MRGLLHKLGHAFEWMDAIEFTLPAILAAALLVAGPVAAIVHFLQSSHYVAAVGAASLWILADICCIRDFRSRKFSPVTGILLAAWLIGTLIIWWKLQTL